MRMVSARELFLKQHRFDLIYKYLFVVRPHDDFVRHAYLESIRAFNGFHEIEPSDGIPKDSESAFVDSFEKIIQGMRGMGFAAEKGAIPIGDNGEISDGAHRLAAAAAFGLDVVVEPDGRKDLYDWRFFREHGMDAAAMDYGALEYVKLNPRAYIVNLHAVTPPERDTEVERILEQYGFIYYKKDIRVSYNGYVNLKKLSYGSFWDREGWIGTPENEYAGAQMHARESYGNGTNPLRVYVFVCDDLGKVVKAKAEIRELYGRGNFSVHINDSREEAIWLAETYFNANSLRALNARPFLFEDARFEAMLEELKAHVAARNGRIGDVCAAASTVLNALGLRRCDDFDFIARQGAGLEIQTEKTLSSVEPEWIRFYPCSDERMLDDPVCHFYYHGVKFVAPEVVVEMKRRRQSGEKDRRDIELLMAMLRPGSLHVWRKNMKKFLSAVAKFIYTKEKRPDGRRKVRILRFIGISYERKRK